MPSMIVSAAIMPDFIAVWMPASFMMLSMPAESPTSMAPLQ